MSLREIRKNRKITQRELAQKSGVNFRSLQDYEQGHKKLTSASGDSLLRLATVLGCSMEELLMPDEFEGAELLQGNTVEPSVIQSQRIYCEKYSTAGRFVCCENKLSVLFYYEGQPCWIPFRAHFTEKFLPFLVDAAVLMMEDKIEEIIFEKNQIEWW